MSRKQDTQATAIIIISICYFFAAASRTASSCVYAAAGANSVDVWDLDNGHCKQMFRVLPNDHVPAVPTLLDANAAAPNAAAAAGGVSAVTDPNGVGLQGTYGVEELQHQLTQTDIAASESVRALLAPPVCVAN